MVTVSNILEYLNTVAPVSTKMDFDNVGLLVGRENRKVTKILVALDITKEVIKEAINIRADLIVSHHPLFFSLKKIIYSDLTGSKIIDLIENNVAAICMHTNLDMAKLGVNTCLAKTVGISKPEFLIEEGTNEFGENYGLGCYGELDSSVKFDEYLQYVKEAINAKGLRYCGIRQIVKKVAVLGGSGGSELESAAAKGCDTYITADVKYDVFLKASELGINIIDGGHFCTENVVVEQIVSLLKQKFDGLEIVASKMHHQIENFI